MLIWSPRTLPSSKPMPSMWTTPRFLMRGQGLFQFFQNKYRKHSYLELLNIPQVVSLSQLEYISRSNAVKIVLSSPGHLKFNALLFKAQAEFLQQCKNFTKAIARKKIEKLWMKKTKTIRTLDPKVASGEHFGTMPTMIQLSATLWRISTLILQHVHSGAVQQGYLLILPYP